MEPIGNDVPIDYLYWLLRTPQYRSYCRAHATGTTNLGLAREDFLAFPAPEPTAAQRAIAHILGTLDDKIELNRRMNETLEAMARAIFKSWFVDFDPVHAKAEGRDPGLPEHIADLFPDRFEDSELGEIPAGWGVGVLDQYTDSVIGGDWGVAEPMEDRSEKTLCIRGADIPSLQVGGIGKMPARYVKSSSLKKRQLDDGDLVIEISETVRKGVRATLQSWIWLVYGGRNEPKSPSLATRRATLQVRPRLFGQFLRRKSNSIYGSTRAHLTAAS